MTLVKICGIRRAEDIEYLNNLKPDYAGFVFAESKRKVDVNTAYSLIKNLDRQIKKVGVFVNEKVSVVKDVAVYLNLDVLQFHGDEQQDYIDNFDDYTVWKAIRISEKSDVFRLRDYNVDGILLDSKINGFYGGSGMKFDWNLVNDVKDNLKCKFILAGGINPDNVLKAVETARPDVIDVSSGVEVGGFKNYQLMKDLICKVRSVKW
ncbi:MULTISPECIES: phosphoribosylanthranilate isomerase [Thermoanaerobacterium]|uniref:N-(5'-phosphoribosyl)anthranilate isomerase n=1 Tax=Thermoanaerobacterium xylanolyticum (strain ATCC 49914 / DSM 7097 / LX-11) TaxID=858215 RepID=F6BGV4_THEXL|nr:phosphoribosylanthranilate isomerase [Thermoanaerobacterium xylanolyticum]AEF17501.1 Phosphoribosylanthranilate isomerase [Thermoanaerobacterium xylanolyticum LX-11]